MQGEHLSKLASYNSKGSSTQFQVMVGRVRLHKLQQQKETKLIIEEVTSI